MYTSETPDEKVFAIILAKAGLNRIKKLQFDFNFFSIPLSQILPAPGQGAIAVTYNKENILDFFILPPSKSELKRRLKKRGRDNNEEINLRLSYAINEMKHYKEYKYVLINDNVKNTVNEIKRIIEYNDLISEKKNILKSKLNKIINP